MRVPVCLAALSIGAALTAMGQPRRGPDRNAAAFDRFRRMSPNERQRALQKLPPERARHIQERMADLDGMPPEQRMRLNEQYRWFQQLPPERKAAMRDAFRRFRQLPEERRRAVYQEFQSTRPLSAPERERRFSGDEFRSRFTTDERGLIEEMTSAVSQ